MPLFAESKDRILGEILYNLVNDTSIRRTSPGSKARAFAEAVSDKLGLMYKKFDLNFAQAFLDGAGGRYLDFFGEMMGVPRLGRAPSTVGSSELNLKFYVDTGTFGTINGGNSILLTTGTYVSTGNGNTGIVYRIPYNIILSSSVSETYVAAEAIQAGSESNLGRGQLNYHDFISYTDYSNNSLKVTNEADIPNGIDGEVDSNYRYRIANQVLASEKANAMAIRLAILEVPGVADLVMLPFFRGIGSFDALIKATTPTVSDALIAAVQENVGNTQAHGIVGTIRAPRELGLSLTGKLTLKKKLPEDEQSQIITAATTNVTDYVNSLDIGEDWIVNEIVERVMSVSVDVKNIGVANKPLESIYIYKPSQLEDNKIRNTVIGDYEPEEDERIIVEQEYAGDTPILFSIV